MDFEFQGRFHCKPQSETRNLKQFYLYKMKHFTLFTKQDILNLTQLRRFETKLGERIHYIADITQLEPLLKDSAARYIIFGIPEDIGVKANMGVGGPTLHGILFYPLSSIYKAVTF